MHHRTIVSSDFTTRGLPADEQFDAYCAWASMPFETENRREYVGFAASSIAFYMGDMVMTVCDIDPLRHIRSARRIRRDQMDHFLITSYRSGSWQCDAGASHTFGNAGEIGVIDLAQTFTAEPDRSFISLFVPRDLLEAHISGVAVLHGCSIAGPYANLLANYLDVIADSLPSMEEESGEDLSTATFNLLVACLKPSVANTSRARPQLDAILIHRAKRYIHGQLRSPSLSPDTVAIALSVSRRTLYRAFEPLGGIQRYILGKRLDGVYDDLLDQEQRHKICEIAEAFGFGRMDYFSRVFKNRFGHCPADLRRRISSRTSVALASGAPFKSADLARWIRELGS